MLKAVIFDLDGVVIDSHPIHRRAWRRFLDSIGVYVSDHDLEYVTEGGKREDILRHFLGPLSQEQVVEYGHRKEQLFREEALEIEPVKGLPEFLAELERAGVAIGLGSCGSRARVVYVLERLGWYERFEVVVTGDDVVHGKPDPSIFRAAGEKLRAPCCDTLVIEDAVPGVQAAVAAGMKAIGVATNGGTKALLAAGALRVVPDFAAVHVSELQQLFCAAPERRAVATS